MSGMLFDFCKTASSFLPFSASEITLKLLSLFSKLRIPLRKKFFVVGNNNVNSVHRFGGFMIRLILK
jgi:hypothetical protein